MPFWLSREPAGAPNSVRRIKRDTPDADARSDAVIEVTFGDNVVGKRPVLVQYDLAGRGLARAGLAHVGELLNDELAIDQDILREPVRAVRILARAVRTLDVRGLIDGTIDDVYLREYNEHGHLVDLLEVERDNALWDAMELRLESMRNSSEE